MVAPVPAVGGGSQLEGHMAQQIGTGVDRAGVTTEVRQKLRAFAATATPDDAKDLTHRFFSHLGRALVPQHGQGPPAPSGERSRVVFSVRGVARPGDSPKASWAIEYWLQHEGKLAGEVREEAAILPMPGGAATASIEAASYKDVLDLASERSSPLLALARRRVLVSGEAMAAVRKLRPAVLEAMKAVVSDLPMLEAQRSVHGDITGSWMPNEASPCCVICKQPWRPLRRRHHCRGCGILVCRHCSTCRASSDGIRRCVHCAGGSTLLSSSVVSVESVQNLGAQSLGAGHGVPADAFTEGADAAPALPPGVEALGLLPAQLGARLAEEVSSPIKAVPPNSCQRRLWERLSAVEAAAAADQAKSGLASLAWSALLGLVALLARFVGYAALCLAVSVTADDLPRPVRGLGEAALERLPLALPRLLLLALAAAPAGAGLRPAPLGAVAAGAAAWRWAAARGGGALPWPLVAEACLSYPAWASFCMVTAVFALIAERLLGRLIHIYLTASVPITIYVTCRQIERTFGLSSETSQVWLYDNADSLMAPFLTNRFLALGGLFVKLGQWVSNMAYGVPITLQSQLKRLTDNAPADREAHVRSLLEAEFGRPMEELFDSFDYKPIASASIGQVHSAVLRGSKGKKVAVKLQHEGIEPIMHSDLRALKRIVRFVSWLGGEKWQDTMRMLEAWAADMLYELDFAHEAQNLREVRAGLASAGVDVVVPVELEGWISRRAFVMEFCEGFRFTDPDLLALHGVDRMALGARALHATACQLLELGLFNSDPHSGNLLCQVRGDSAIPVLLDFGNCIRLPEAQRLAYCRLLIALSEMSVTKSREALDKIGLITTQSGSHPERDLEFMLLMFRDTGSRSQQDQGKKDFFELRRNQRQEDMEASGAQTKTEKKKVRKQLKRYPTQVPDEFILFVRMMHLVRGLCTQLDAQLPFLQIFEGHARRALATLQPLALRALAPLPPEEPPARGGLGLPAAKAAELRRRLRAAIAQACSERPGLGLQVCLYVGKTCAADECGGVLGAVDPRPMTRATPVPLADLSRLPLLLAARAEARAGRLSYGAPLAPLLGGTAPPANARCPQLRHALAHVALASPDDAEGRAARGAVAKITAGDLCNAPIARKQLLAAVAPSPLDADHAAYLPLGAGYAAAAALEASAGLAPQAALRRLPGFAEGELAFGPPAGAAPAAALSSALFADMRAALGGGGPPGGGGGGNFLGALGGASPAGSREGGMAGGSPGAAASSTGGGLRSAVGSILDAAGGLLVDPALAGSTVAAAGSGGPSSLCPDLAGAASARALAAVLAAAEPVAEASPVMSREAPPSEGGVAALLGGICPPRAWDERGLEVFAAEGGAAAAAPPAVGLQACGGLLGAAVQWRAGGASKAVVTAVVLSTELSIAGLPGRLLSEATSALGLSPLAAFRG